MKLSLFDAYINVLGGLRLDEPGADLPVVLALASSYRDAPIADDLVVRDGCFITGKGPGAAIPFALEIVKVLVSEETAKTIKEAMQCL